MGYFDTENKRKAAEVLGEIHECAEKAGIRRALFVGFGLLLGIVRERDFIGHDNDVDMCVRSDLVQPDQELDYYRRLREAGLFFARRRWAFRNDRNGFNQGKVQPSLSDSLPGSTAANVRFAWFSLRKRKDYCKFCHWFFFPWNGYQWHTKGNMWVSRRKFDPGKFGYDASYDAIMKGIPAEFVEKLIKVKNRVDPCGDLPQTRYG